MTPPEVSVVIVSRGRPDALRLCLIGVSQLRYPRFEVIIVTDAQGQRAVDGWREKIKLVPFDEANISAARNAGLAVAAGEIVAFIDDDAVPEPTWLSYLAGPFAQETVAAAGGFVRGRNGISFQWKARDIGPDGSSDDLRVDAERATVLTPAKGRGIKTEGTNMAFRRAVLAGIGGFDPAYRFYLDESDVNLRLARAGHQTAIVPLAQVHHGFAPSDRRRADRAPRDLGEIAASIAVVLRRYCVGMDTAKRWADERAAQRRRLLRHMVAGALEPRDVRRLMRSFDRGRAEGEARPLAELAPLGDARSPFLPFVPEVAPRGHRVLCGWRIARRRLKAEAADLVQDGYLVSLFLFSLTARFHHVRFSADGYWLQQGGLFGRSERQGPLFQAWRRQVRLKSELSRVSKVRIGTDGADS